MLAFIWIHIYNICTQLCAWIYIVLLYSVDYIKLYCHIRYELRTSSEFPFRLQKKKCFYRSTVSTLPLQTDQTGQSPAGWAPTDRQTRDKEHSSSKWAPSPVQQKHPQRCLEQPRNMQSANRTDSTKHPEGRPHLTSPVTDSSATLTTRVHPKFGSLWR